MPEMALNNSDLNHAPMKKAPHDVQL